MVYQGSKHLDLQYPMIFFIEQGLNSNSSNQIYCTAVGMESNLPFAKKSKMTYAC